MDIRANQKRIDSPVRILKGKRKIFFKNCFILETFSYESDVVSFAYCYAGVIAGNSCLYDIFTFLEV